LVFNVKSLAINILQLNSCYLKVLIIKRLVIRDLRFSKNYRIILNNMVVLGLLLLVNGLLLRSKILQK